MHHYVNMFLKNENLRLLKNNKRIKNNYITKKDDTL